MVSFHGFVRLPDSKFTDEIRWIWSFICCKSWLICIYLLRYRSIYVILMYIYGKYLLMCMCCNVGIAIINHPPFIAIFMGGIPTIKNGWFMTLLYPHYRWFSHLLMIISMAISHLEINFPYYCGWTGWHGIPDTDQGAPWKLLSEAEDRELPMRRDWP